MAATTTTREKPLVGNALGRAFSPLRFLHLGDLHLGPNARNKDRIRALDQIIDEGCQQPLAAWLGPGDLNNSLMTVFDKNILTTRTIRMANHAPVIWIYGNHDVPGDIDFLEKLAAAYPIYVVARPTVLRVPLAVEDGVHMGMGEAAIFCFPYPSRLGLIAAGTPSELIVSAAREALDAIFTHAAAQLAAAAAEGAIPLMIGHVNVGGSILSAGQPNIGREIELDPTLLDRLGPIYKGLNHIHKAQEIAGAHYAGSVCRLDWGEIEEKRYLTIDYDRISLAHKGGPDAIWHHTVESHTIDVAPMYHVEGTLTREGFDWTCDDGGYAEQAGPGFFAGAEVRARVRFAAAERELLDFALVKAPFVGAIRIDLDPIPTHTRAIRAPEVAAAVTLEDKVAAFIVSTGETWTPSLADKLARLQEPDGPAYFTHLAEELAAIAAVHDVDETPVEVRS
jgi:DNA repair exonuclease SbcCD nuclease subunit